jgi:lipoprotein-anchoring transpeptidase ErfK/SrfK
MPSRMAAPRRSVAGALAITAALGLSVAVAQSAAADVRVARQQLVAVLSTDHTVWQRPDGERLAVVVSALRPITHEATVLPVLRQTVDSAGRSWLLVRLPGRTLGSPSPPSTGWIASPGTQLRATPWHIVVDLAARELTVYNDGHAVRRFSAIVGKPTTPTPVGQYFVEEDVVMTAGAAGGPFALATSDRSDVLKEFDGGPGQIAIHGLNELGGQLGTAESHGCVRLSDANVTWLAAHAGAGTPVTIE